MPALSHSCQQREASLGSRRDSLIIEHMPQVRLIARRIQERLPQHIALDDLVSTGTLGLIAAIAGWKFRVMQPAQPPTSRVANP